MTEDNELKQRLFEACKCFLLSKRRRIQSKIQDIQEALETETKSSAGDKHETGRAMLQLEREKLGSQLVHVENSERVLGRIDLINKLSKAGLGSVIFTTQINYFISISCGEIKIDGLKFYGVSSSTPIALELMGKLENETFEFRGLPITILKIL